MEIALLNLLAEVNKSTNTDSSSTKLPALNRLVSTIENPGKVRTVLVAHVLNTAIEYIEVVNKVFPVESVIAVPYSADPVAVEHLRNKGFDVVIPESVLDTFDIAFKVTQNALNKSDIPLMVQEVGGYLAKYIDALQSYEHFIGVVEDTNNGHWRYEQHEPYERPILSMAQSPLKDVEDTIIGDAVVYSTERILREEYSAILQGSRCGVIGYGKIGTSTAIALRGREAVVSIYDINPAKDMRAKVEGFFPLPLHELLPECDIVVGCTGQTSIRIVDMEYIKDGAMLVSASSKDIEFALNDFAANCSEIKKINDVTHKYTQKNGKAFYVLNGGTPINFRDKSILGTILDMIYCELFVCMREVSNGKVTKGLGRIPKFV